MDIILPTSQHLCRAKIMEVMKSIQFTGYEHIQKLDGYDLGTNSCIYVELGSLKLQYLFNIIGHEQIKLYYVATRMSISYNNELY